MSNSWILYNEKNNNNLNTYGIWGVLVWMYLNEENIKEELKNVHVPKWKKKSEEGEK